LPNAGSVFISPGTTAYQLAVRIPASDQLRVVTNALEVALYLASNRIATVDLLGGTIRTDSLSSDLLLAEDDLEELYWDVTFMGAVAIDVSRGITTIDRIAAQWERRLMEIPGKVVVLADSSKIGKVSFARVAPVGHIDVLITDSGISPALVERLVAEQVRVEVVGPPEARPSSEEATGVQDSTVEGPGRGDWVTLSGDQA